MGFSVSGSAAIIFIGVIVAAGVAVPSIIGDVGSLAGAQGKQVDRGIDTLNTDIEIEAATYNATDDGLALRAANVGSTSLSVNGTSVLLDGTIPSTEDVTTDVEGNEATGLWLSGETLNVTVGGVSPEPNRVKIVTENGIAEIAEVEP